MKVRWCKCIEDLICGFAFFFLVGNIVLALGNRVKIGDIGIFYVLRADV